MCEIMANDPPNASKIIQLSTHATPGYVHVQGLTEESANRVSELLTTNHALYHMRWGATFHNHIVHHLLALWALGASPNEVQDMWELNRPYQSSIEPQHTDASDDLDLKDPVLFEKCLGKDEHYADFLRFFEEEVTHRGPSAVIREYLLNGDERANDIFGRTFTDLMHPMIHLGCAIEFQQPSLTAEALAGACAHDNWPKEVLLPAEDYTRSNTEVPDKSLLQILDDLRGNVEIVLGVRDSDPFNKIPDGLMTRISGKQLAPYLGQFRVRPTPEDLQRKLCEMMHTCAYVMGAAQRPGKHETMDFVLLHNVTLCVFYPAILAQDWLSDAEKARMLEAKARFDLLTYAGCACPPLHPERIIDYKPRHPHHDWPELFHRSIVYPDEGHVVKLIRAMYCLEQLSGTGSELPISKGDFVKIAHMIVDSVERVHETDGHKMSKDFADARAKAIGKGGEMVVGNMTRWVFYGGLPRAWDFVPDLATPASTPASA